ncbi:hypothetical protein EJB05_02438, partial [Eragrostis curvula]
MQGERRVNPEMGINESCAYLLPSEGDVELSCSLPRPALPAQPQLLAVVAPIVQPQPRAVAILSTAATRSSSQAVTVSRCVHLALRASITMAEVDLALRPWKMTAEVESVFGSSRRLGRYCDEDEQLGRYGGGAPSSSFDVREEEAHARLTAAHTEGNQDDWQSRRSVLRAGFSSVPLPADSAAMARTAASRLAAVAASLSTVSSHPIPPLLIPIILIPNG